MVLTAGSSGPPTEAGEAATVEAPRAGALGTAAGEAASSEPEPPPEGAPQDTTQEEQATGSASALTGETAAGRQKDAGVTMAAAASLHMCAITTTAAPANTACKTIREKGTTELDI